MDGGVSLKGLRWKGEVESEGGKQRGRGNWVHGVTGKKSIRPSPGLRHEGPEDCAPPGVKEAAKERSGLKLSAKQVHVSRGGLTGADGH